MRTQRETIKSMVRRHGQRPQEIYFRFWDDDPDIIRPLLSDYMSGANDVLKTADVGELERIRDHRNLPVELQGALIGKIGMAKRPPEGTYIIDLFRQGG